MFDTRKLLNVSTSPVKKLNFRPHSLRWRLLFLLSLVFFMALTVIGMGTYYFIYRTELQTWQQRQLEAAKSASQIAIAPIERTRDILILVGSVGASDLISNPQIMPLLLQENPLLLELLRLDATGHPLPGAYRDKPVLANSFTIPQSSWFLQAKNGQFYLGSIQVSSDSEPYVVVAVPARDGGVVAARLRMTVLWDLMSNLTFGNTGQSFAVNRENQIIAHSNPSVALSNISLEEWTTTTDVEQILGQNRMDSYTNIEGNKVIGVALPVPKIDLIIVTEIMESEVFATSRRALILLISGLVLVWIIVMWVTSRNLDSLVLRPLEQLQLGARRIGRGDLNYRLRLDQAKKDEMSLVAGAFNRMASRLNDRTLALEASEERFRRVVSSITDHIYATEIASDGTITNIFISPNVIELTGYSAETLAEDWTFWPSKIIHSDDRSVAQAQVDRFSRGQNSTVEYRLVRADGETIWVRDSGRVERNPENGKIVVYAVVSDITAKKEAEVALKTARDQALEASRLKSELLARVSHELRTPLGAILGFAEVLGLEVVGPLNSKQKEIVQHMIISSKNLAAMVNELLDQARLEAGMVSLNNVEFSPQILLEYIQVTAGVLAQNKGLDLSTELAANVPPTLVGDAQRLQQILTNLTGNAIKFTERGSVQVCIFCPDETHWAIRVSDTGPGISKEAQAFIFDPFRQADGSITRRYGGSGLGLSITKKLTKLMNGEIYLDSSNGSGATFTVALPLNLVPERLTDC